MKVELDLPNYAIKADLINRTRVETSEFVKKNDLANLKSDVNKLDIDKLEIVPTIFNRSKRKVDKLNAGTWHWYTSWYLFLWILKN